MLDGFTKHYPDDGGCDEGPSYWNVAGASYFDCLELIYDMTGGRIDVFSNPFVRRIMEYIMHMHVVDNFYLNFADSPAKLQWTFLQLPEWEEEQNQMTLKLLDLHNIISQTLHNIAKNIQVNKIPL